MEALMLFDLIKNNDDLYITMMACAFSNLLSRKEERNAQDKDS